jgi:hypothetical protein
MHGTNVKISFNGDLLFCLQRTQEEIIYGRTNRSLNSFDKCGTVKSYLEVNIFNPSPAESLSRAETPSEDWGSDGWTRSIGWVMVGWGGHSTRTYILPVSNLSTIDPTVTNLALNLDIWRTPQFSGWRSWFVFRRYQVQTLGRRPNTSIEDLAVSSASRRTPRYCIQRGHEGWPPCPLCMLLRINREMKSHPKLISRSKYMHTRTSTSATKVLLTAWIMERFGIEDRCKLYPIGFTKRSLQRQGLLSWWQWQLPKPFVCECIFPLIL